MKEKNSVKNKKAEPYGSKARAFYRAAKPYAKFKKMADLEKLKDGKTNISLFKYMPLSNCFFQNHIVPDGVLFAIRFASPHGLNDHFDSLPKFKGKSNNIYLESILERLQNRYRWCCFSKDFENPLLWALYGDEGRGICVEYELYQIERAVNNKLVFQTITYQQSPYATSIKPDSDEAKDRILTKALMKKSLLWAFEQEIRAVIVDDGKQALPVGGCPEDFGMEMPFKRGKELAWKDNCFDLEKIIFEGKELPFVYRDEESFYLPVKPKTLYLGPQLNKTCLDRFKQERPKYTKPHNPSEPDELENKIAALKTAAARLRINVCETDYSPEEFKIEK